jgi:hypothetical protein
MKIRAFILCPIALTLVLFTGLAFPSATAASTTQSKKKKSKTMTGKVVSRNTSKEFTGTVGRLFQDL